MARNNNDEEKSSHMPEPTMRDLFNMLQNCPSKNDLEAIKTQIVDSNSETIAKVEDIARRTDSIEDTQQQHTDKIQALEISMEQLKQEHLKNNICVSGVPPAIIKKENNTARIVTLIAKSLGVVINESQFTSYAVSDNKFVIIHFYNMSHKQMIINKIRVKRSLMAEEVFQRCQSNSQIYLNDHLTPYFNKLYLIARNAKKDGKLFSASSYGGKIRARKSEDDMPTVITNERQLQAIIEDEGSDMSYTTVQQSTNTSSSSSVAIVSPSASNSGNANSNNTRAKRTHGTQSSGCRSSTNHRNNNNINNSVDSLTKTHRKNNSNSKTGKHSKRLLDVSGNAGEASKSTKVRRT